MAIIKKSARLKKSLTLRHVFALAMGATLSSGFFLLPGLAAEQAGSTIVLCYVIAAVPVIPLILSVSELGTAMPRAGGAYYFVDRSLGPLFGTIAGIGTWLSLILKTAFALIGMGAYAHIIFPGVNIIPIAVSFALFFGVVNLLGAKRSAGFQIYMVGFLLFILALFIVAGVGDIHLSRFDSFFEPGMDSIISTSGLVFISYLGVTKVASVAEEISNPERNFPLGIMLAIALSVLIYVAGIAVMVGVVPMGELRGSLTPAAAAAEKILGPWGERLIIAAAMLAFFSVANAAILSASRYPIAMSRDGIMPNLFASLSRLKTPIYSVILTVAIIIVCLFFFNPIKIAKLASSFQLLMVSLLCTAVIVMRESRIDGYDPGYHSPFYPWIQLLGIAFSIILISLMGMGVIAATVGLILVGMLWYLYYSRRTIYRSGAIYHIFARLGSRKYKGLESELRGILREKGLREEDSFDEVLAHAEIIDLPAGGTFDDAVGKASSYLARRTSYPIGLFTEGFMQGTKVGATPVSHGIALPHLRLPHLDKPEMVIVRSIDGVRVEIEEEFFGEEAATKPIHAMFFLISPEDDAGQHLRILAQIAEVADNDDFIPEWLGEKTHQDLKEILLRKERFLSLRLLSGTPAGEWIGKEVREIDAPEGSLIAIIHRDGEIVVPHGNTVLQDGDRLTIVGDRKGISELKAKFPSSV